MGGTFSALTTPIKDREFLELILKEMFRRADFADLYSLADPAQCQSYVIVGANALESMFFKLRIYPQKREDGTLYFQKISGLQGRLPSDVRSIQQQHCKELAFFFVRIFQIFGALFLSVYDSEFPNVDPPDTTVAQQQMDARQPFLRAQDVFRPALTQKKFGWFGFGGELNEGRGYFLTYDGDEPLLGAYKHFLNRYLYISRSANAEADVLFLTRNIKIRLGVMPANGVVDDRMLGDNTVSIEGVEYTFKRRVDRREASYVLSATMKIQYVQGREYEIILDDFKWIGDQPKTIKDRTDTRTRVEWREEDGVVKGIDIPGAFDRVVETLFSRVVDDIVEPPESSTANYLEKWSYVGNYFSNNQPVKGAKEVYLVANQQTSSTAKLVWRTYITIEDKPVQVSVSAMLNIEREDFNTYKISLNFFDNSVSPERAREHVSLPGEKSKIFTTITDRDKPKSSDDMTIPQFIEQTFKETAPGSSDSASSASGTKIRFNEKLQMFEPYDSSSIPPGFKVKGLWKAMAQNPPIKAHCIARASQLLSSDALHGIFKREAFSSICRLKFGYQVNQSLPTPKKPITTSAGILALANLFVDTLHDGSPKLTADKKKWYDFRQKMTNIFELYRLDSDTVPSEKFDDIKQATFEKCDSIEDKRIAISRQLAYNLREVTQNLLNQQRNHIERVFSIIFKLFDKDELKSKKRLTFNDELYTRGMERVKEISDEAIALLTDYYKNCELTYQQGVAMIYHSSGSEPFKAYDAAST